MKTLSKLLVAAFVLSGCTSLELSTEAGQGGNASGSQEPILEQMAKDSAAG
jgi:hypothetical protein